MTWLPGFDASRVPAPGDRVFAFVERRLLLLDGVVPRADASGWPAAVYVGEIDGAGCFAVELPESPAGLEAIGLREALAELPSTEAAGASRAIQTLEWERDHRYCGRCGSETEPVGIEPARSCEGCGTRYYPRISPAVIMLVTRGDRLLLARRPGGANYSCLAGFVEAGESLEEAVVREVREEVGLEVEAVRYFGSQPWPFPGQLMVGFHAEAADGEIELLDAELEEAQWYARGEPLPSIPPPFTIARRLIDAF